MITELITRQKQTTLLENQMEESWKLKLHIKMRKVNIIIRKDNDHNDVIVPTCNIYTVERYYRHNKSIPSLRHLIVRAKQVNEPDYKPHFCIIYSNSSDELEKPP